ncbi:cytochrome-c peroxidase [Shewanella surugensis]|uniref:Cytochrome-c peroxidase n=1 Tax=Shewanella surugensis TaxID=212020 RepID=A0ABT0LJ46_9GAMM|nr:cytochrome-c peroxidase [Shewanella surugensis]MCL1127724.1 cytochrome-c peroxidase [Shewanella surugensis]
MKRLYLSLLIISISLSCAVYAADEVTDSLREPIEQIREELTQYILENNLQPLASRPYVSEEMYILGQSLAFDKILSGNQDTSCMSCHHPLLATGDARSLPLGVNSHNLGQERVGGDLIARHSPSLFNLDLFSNLFWDGRIELDDEGELHTPASQSGDLTQSMIDVFYAAQENDGFEGYGLVAAQAMFPVTDATEMRGEGSLLGGYSNEDFKEIWQALMVRLGGVPEYVQLFEAAYPNVPFESMTFAHAANAIAAFEIRAFDFRDNPWQAVISDVAADASFNDHNLLSEEATRGAHFFFETGCSNCHSGAVMSDFDFHSTATIQYGPGKGDGASGFEDYGRENITLNETDRAKFRTAPLFNIDLTAPYARLGQFNDLWSHIQIYAIPERFWLNQYSGYDRFEDTFTLVPEFETHVSDREKVLLKTLPLPSFDDVQHGFIRTLEYIETQFSRASSDVGRLTSEEGKRLGDGELVLQRQILIPFMEAQTDLRALSLIHLIPESVASGLPVEKGILEGNDATEELVANLGQTFTIVDLNNEYQLNGELSTGEIASYEWSIARVNGLELNQIVLSEVNTATPIISVIEQPYLKNANVTIRLQVTDYLGHSHISTLRFNIEISSVAEDLIAQAGDDFQIIELNHVYQLDGSQSTGDIASYSWSIAKVNGMNIDAVHLNDTGSPTPVISVLEAPADNRASINLKLKVSDSVGNTHQDTLRVKVQL